MALSYYVVKGFIFTVYINPILCNVCHIYGACEDTGGWVRDLEPKSHTSTTFMNIYFFFGINFPQYLRTVVNERYRHGVNIHPSQ